MIKNNKLLIIGIIAVVAVFCQSATNTPWDGTAWDVTAPDIDELVGNHYKEIFDLRKGVAIRMNKEHETLATSSAGGVHKQGSARAFFQDAPPTTQIDGTAWDSGDTGSLWFDTNSTPDNLAYVLTNHASTGTWTLLSTSTIAETVAAAHQWADVQTFDLQTVHTLGLLANGNITLGAGDDLVGSATSAINMQAFDVDEAGVATLGTSLNIASTIAVVGTIDDDTMATATNTTVSTSESITAYVDAVSALLPSGLTADNNTDGEISIGELKLKWGNSTRTGTATTVTFTTPFVKCFQVIGIHDDTAIDTSGGAVGAITETNFVFYVAAGVTGMHWFAIGR